MRTGIFLIDGKEKEVDLRHDLLVFVGSEIKIDEDYYTVVSQYLNTSLKMVFVLEKLNKEIISKRRVANYSRLSLL